MDDLDRLYHRLVAAIREASPHLLAGRFRLGDVASQLVPYRLHRRDLGIEGVDRYERALARLAAGDRGYLLGDAAMQRAFRDAPETPGVATELLRQHADAPVALSPAALEAAGYAPEAAPADRGTSRPDDAPVGAAPPPRAAEDPAPSAGDRTPPHGVAATTGDQPAGRGPEEPPPSTGTPGVASAGSPTPTIQPATIAPADTAVAATGTGGAGVPPAHLAPATPPPTAPAMPFPARPRPQVTGGRCRYCGHDLPEDRAVTFCPHCGQDVTRILCPACSTPLELGWRFCITCGRPLEAEAGGGGMGGGGSPGGAAGDPALG